MAPPFPFPHPSSQGPREEVCPPDVSSGPWWRSLRDWLVLGWSTGPRRAERDGPGSLLAEVRAEFAEMLDDLPDEAAQRLYDRIYEARSLRELWHLRAELHALVSRRFDQVTADERLQALNRHFPRRQPRASSFGALPARDDLWP